LLINWLTGQINVSNNQLEDAVTSFEAVLNTRIPDRKFDFSLDFVVIDDLASTLYTMSRPLPVKSPERKEWLKKSILMFFSLRGMETIEVGPFEYADKLPLKHGFAEAGVRALPGASARWGSYLARGVVLMPSYVNIGARVGADSMVDTWATVASCAQIGERVHLAGGVGIGGVLEPPNAVPVVVEDDAFVGSRCMVTGGARIGKGAVLGAGSFLDPSIPVIDAETGEEISRGEVPSWCVAIRASRRREYPGGEFFVPCVLVIKRLSEGERHDKAQLNQILRDHGAST